MVVCVWCTVRVYNTKNGNSIINETPLAQPPPKGFKQEPHIRGVFCLWDDG